MIGTSPDPGSVGFLVGLGISFLLWIGIKADDATRSRGGARAPKIATPSNVPKTDGPRSVTRERR